jgi:AraC family transcriptional regulator, transcriptional activator FtrA
MTYIIQFMPKRLDRLPAPKVGPSGPLVVALVYEGLCLFEFAIVAEIFGLSRPELGAGWYRFASVAIEPGPLSAQGGLSITCDNDMDVLAEADLIVVPGWKGIDVDVPEELVQKLRLAHARGARLASICSGAFVLAATGLLAGQHAATHWRYADAFSSRYPEIKLEADVLYVEADRLLTSAGSAAGIDLMLHIIRQDFGLKAANSVARRLVMPPHRTGGQAQFIERPVPAETGGKLSNLLETIRQEPARNWSIKEMASRALMSHRTFIRKFTETTGLPPGEWIVRLRVEEAKGLLETSSSSIDAIALQAGFGSVEALRHHFRKHAGLPPREYRRTFAPTPSGAKRLT